MVLPSARPDDTSEEMAHRIASYEEEIGSLSREILERYEEASLVYRLSDCLGDVMGEDAIARLVLEEAARILGATFGEIWLGTDTGVELIGRVPESPPGVGPDTDSALRVLQEERPWIREAGDGVEAVAAVPLPDPGGAPIGVLVLHGRPEGKSYRTGEVKLLTALASLTSSFIRNGRLAAAARLAEAKKREDEIARQVHQGLLPHREPDFPGLEVAGICHSADMVGGDYYGYLEMPDGGLGLAMADVSGHGVGAALYMAAAKGAIQAEARRVIAPSDLLRRANEALTEDFSRSDVFATTFFAHFLPGARKFEYSNGGHNPPIVVRGEGGIEKLRRGGVALGVVPDMIYQEETLPFAEGDLLLIYTDGLVEARNERGQFYGTERLERIAAACRGRDANTVLRCIMKDLQNHCGGMSLRDDVTLVVARGIGVPAGSEEDSDE